MKENVVRLHIPMHNVVLVQNLKGFQQLFEDEKRVWLRELALLGEEILESASIAKLVDKVEVIGSFEHVVVLDDVSVCLDVGQDVDLVHSTLLQLLILFELVYGYHLDSVFFFVRVVDGPVDFAVDTRADLLIKDVVLYLSLIHI